ncbi:MAG: tetratricopeptide repeat protein [Deltaproteobacteria bacterium]|nr:tetratricopeptide repeat protein [Deltaproteobacteria bacterium]MBW2421577.1 tetratricopeptide repeat protein [Deltaproteobacteria bacterium]
MKRLDLRPWIVLGTVAAVSLLGLAVRWAPSGGVVSPGPAPTEPRASAEDAEASPGGLGAAPDSPRKHEIAKRFERAVLMLHAKRYEYAIASLDRVLELSPGMPEAHVNMGYALIGLGRHALAAEHFTRAIDLRPTQSNAYYGLANSLDELGDREGARGAMRAFIHLSDAGDPFVRKARAALWEWESGPTGPSPGAAGAEEADTGASSAEAQG